MFLWNAGTYQQTLTTQPHKENYVYFDKPEYRRAFVKAYLESRRHDGKQSEAAAAVTEEDITNLLWKIECHIPRTMIYIGAVMEYLQKDPLLGEDLLEYAKQCSVVFPEIAKEGIALLESSAPNTNESAKQQNIIDNGLLKDLL